MRSNRRRLSPLRHHKSSLSPKGSPSQDRRLRANSALREIRKSRGLFDIVKTFAARASAVRRALSRKKFTTEAQRHREKDINAVDAEGTQWMRVLARVSAQAFFQPIKKGTARRRAQKRSAPSAKPPRTPRRIFFSVPLCLCGESSFSLDETYTDEVVPAPPCSSTWIFVPIAFDARRARFECMRNAVAFFAHPVFCPDRRAKSQWNKTANSRTLRPLRC